MPGALVDADSVERRAHRAIDRGVAWLLTQQDADDRAWHSRTYGSMRGGASSTALVLYAAKHLPARHHQAAHWKQAYDFLRAGIRRRGCVACPDGTLDYPTYSTAMTLIASRTLGLDISTGERSRMIDYLVSAQLSAANGFAPEDVDYGGWDLLGGAGSTGVTSGTNISVTYHAVRAIAPASHPKKKETLARARQWCGRCHNWPAGDGGFYFHPDRQALGNKAQWNDEALREPRSYGSATCDGLSLMILTGGDREDDRVRKAIDWLRRTAAMDVVPGFDEVPDHLGWKEGLKYYFLQGYSRILPLLPKPIRARQTLTVLEEILGLQTPAGFWRNKSPRMREDDPLIATSFALVGLSCALGSK